MFTLAHHSRPFTQLSLSIKEQNCELTFCIAFQAKFGITIEYIAPRQRTCSFVVYRLWSSQLYQIKHCLSVAEVEKLTASPSLSGCHIFRALLLMQVDIINLFKPNQFKKDGSSSITSER